MGEKPGLKRLDRMGATADIPYTRTLNDVKRSMPEVGPRPNDFVINNKMTYSVYYETDLELLLKTLGVDTVVIIGIKTNTCDLCSSFETANRGYIVIAISDCVAGAYGQDLHIFGLQNIARALGWVLTIPEFEEKLSS